MSEHPINQKTNANFALIVTSDTRTEKEDETGRIAISLIESEGHRITAHLIIPNNPEKIRYEILAKIEDPNVDIVITSGGTGIGTKDRTVSTVAPLLEKDMPGFGEQFRRLSYDEVGGAALMSRAIAGVKNGKLVFCLPGSRNAVRLALSKLVLPNIGHMLWELKR